MSKNALTTHSVHVYNSAVKTDAELLREKPACDRSSKAKIESEIGSEKLREADAGLHQTPRRGRAARRRTEPSAGSQIPPHLAEMLQRVAECNSRFRYDMRKAELDYQTRKARRRLKRSLVDHASPDAAQGSVEFRPASRSQASKRAGGSSSVTDVCVSFRPWWRCGKATSSVLPSVPQELWTANSGTIGDTFNILPRGLL